MTAEAPFPHPDRRTEVDGQAPRAAPQPTAGTGSRLAVALRLFVFSGLSLAAISLLSHGSGWPLLSATLGPTLYVFIAHPRSETARLANAALGHGTAVAVGLASLAAFGLWSHPPVSASGAPSLVQVAAVSVALGLTLGLLHLLGLHYAPAAATALLITTGICRPGRPLYGLLVGLALAITFGPLLAKLPLARAAAAAQDDERRHT